MPLSARLRSALNFAAHPRWLADVALGGRPLVFGNLTSGQPAALIDDLVAAEAVSARMRAAWIAFATSGDPGWPTFDSGLVQIFDTEPVVAPYPEAESRKIWQDYSFSPLGLR